jgi:hypothetical protein
MGDRLPVQRSAGRLVPRNPSQGRRDCPSTIQLRAYFARLGLPPVAGTPPPEPFYRRSVRANRRRKGPLSAASANYFSINRLGP